jgi:hypothetical protein
MYHTVPRGKVGRVLQLQTNESKCIGSHLKRVHRVRIRTLDCSSLSCGLDSFASTSKTIEVRQA